MTRDPRDKVLSIEVSRDFRQRVMSQAKQELGERSRSRREFFWHWARNLGLAAATFWLGSRLIPSEDLDESVVLEALSDHSDLFLELDPEDFEILMASEEIEELDDIQEES